MVAKEEGVGEGRDGEVCRYKRLYIEWINSKRIAHGTVFNIL